MRLNQAIAVRNEVKARSHGTCTDINRAFQQKGLFDGFVRTFQPKNDTEDTLPGEKQVVQYRAKHAISALRFVKSHLIDLTAQLDTGNTIAKSGVYVDGTEIVPELPVTTLLALEKELEDLRTLVSNIPLLDDAVEWEWDANAELYRAAPEQTRATRKVESALVLYDATDKHPAQTKAIVQDVTIGHWTKVRLSAAMPRPDKEAAITRVNDLIRAVKEAREEANSVTIQPVKGIGDAIFNFVFAPVGGG